jgi:hypothetical protein
MHGASTMRDAAGAMVSPRRITGRFDVARGSGYICAL